MLVIPAIDVREGKCVRLVQGKLDEETVYSDHPVAVAHSWQDLGAKWLHVVDLDGAFAGRPKNLEVVREIIDTVKIPVQFGGGVRKLDTIEELLSIGVARVILGTIAIIEPALVEYACKRWGDRIVVGIDSKDGLVAIEGWEATVEKQALDLALEMKDRGVERIVFTDTRRDGTLRGPNIESTRKMAKGSGLKVIASGGVSSLEDIKRLKELEPEGVEGVILGKALYSGKVSLEEAIAVAEMEEN
ncbi:1-(5-phosphoribosyl)-5-[(5-phosphoribosylamino)methylideneamino]imidazole-4-carboxamide isomerase [Calderihabitans maritimus]|uniref:1-(5-phosphoribosyl)-5-[(5-phosphoribosylamino)methylideneamino] imidazole-4-carboxamide isomerase n=1 Tax=Calderihabitans maritimus TaxID=1246530 RepID=A0A1Z5HPV3_9FIRM|nr:1-(5-phosphoribosyl)-5-[(5-phosphoribosylamino)methylideneamino]imidazole-4-carboxamide isomerase [Calderihabitans maritimus]GAW91553.1 1-(5-phosphoribosyl)-5-[(5-phosphoribosylamino) methylideneamino] imidazole-4-carboxamide isomerase [Calderihabitans maritimus]